MQRSVAMDLLRQRGGCCTRLTPRRCCTQETWTEVTSATPEQPNAMYAYSNLNVLPEEGFDKLSVGLTYETGDTGCEASAAACKIVYRTFEL